MEANLKSLWAKTLDRSEQEISSESDFFQLGGDSVRAIQLAGQASKAGLELPAQSIFQRPQLKDMAAATREGQSRAQTPEADRAGTSDLMAAWRVIGPCLAQCSMANDDLEDLMPCLPFQRELMRTSQNLGAWVFQAVFQTGSTSSSVERAKHAIEMVRDRDATFRTRIAQIGTEHYQVVSREAIQWETFEGGLQRYKSGVFAKRLCYGDPLARYAVVHQGKATYLVWTMSHAIYDRWSKMATLDDVKSCFRDPAAFVQQPRRPQLRNFVDHVCRLDQEDSIRYWEDQLEGVCNSTFMRPDDSAREDFLNSSPVGVRKSIDFSMPQDSRTNFDTLAHAAWSLVQAEIAKTDQIFYCGLRSCRHLNVPGIQDIIGPLWSLVPVHRKLSGDEELQSLYDQIQHSTIAAIPHEPFGVTALNRHFGHRRYLQCVLLPQPPQPDFGQKVQSTEGTDELRSAEELWTQATGHYGLYIMLTPKAGAKLELWARFDESFVSGEWVGQVLDRYAQMLSMMSNREISTHKVATLCHHLSTSSPAHSDGRAMGTANGSTNGESHPMTLAHLIRSRSKTDAALIMPGDQTLTFTHFDLHKAVVALHHKLASIGIGKGSAVSIALPNSPELITVFLAATWQRAIAAPLNPSYKEDEFAFYIGDLGSAITVIPKDAYDEDGPAVTAARNYGAAIAECYWNGKEMVLDVKEEGQLEGSMGMGDGLMDAKETDIALVLHTSGTTGKPKAVPLTHMNLMSNIANICRTYNLSPQDRTMLIMPLFHVHGLLASFLSPLYSGGSAIVPPRLEPSFWSAFNEHKANWYSATPSMHRLILEFPPPQPLPRIRFIRSCSSQLSPVLYQKLADRFKAPIVESYAMTEASHLMASNPLPPGDQKPGSVGQPQGIEMKLLDGDDREVSRGEEGEVSIRGPNVTKGYLNNAEANKKEFTKDGFFRTGDQGKFDEDGYLILTGRLKEMINKGGEKISPVELDNVIGQHKDVDEVVSFAVDDEAYGQDVGCAVKSAEGREVDEQALKRWIEGRVAAFKVPKKIWLCESIPKTATGKVQRRLVADAMLK